MMSIPEHHTSAHAIRSAQLRRRGWIDRRAFGKHDPRLCAAGPEMRGRPEPRRVVERAAAQHALAARIGPGIAANPHPTFRADPTRADGTAAEYPLHQPRR